MSESFFEERVEYKGIPFDIRVYAEEEDIEPKEVFDETVDDLDDIYDGIRSGKYVWFMVKVVASILESDLGFAYLGGCLYRNYKDFIDESDYYADLKEEALHEAYGNVVELRKIICK